MLIFNGLCDTARPLEMLIRRGTYVRESGEEAFCLHMQIFLFSFSAIIIDNI